ncbi:MAG: TraB/GumN family protein [Luteibaculaceae bacterium]
MKKLTLPLILCLLAVANLFGQDNSLLWKITGNGLEQPSYVFGTMHILCSNEIAEKPALKSAFEESSTLVMELNPTNPEVMQSMQQLALNPGMQNVYKDLDPEDFNLVDAYLKEKFGAGLAQLGILKPFMLTSMVTLGFLPCTEHFSLEGYFATMAAESEMKIVDLETAALQMSLFDEIPLEVQIKEIVRTLKDGNGKKEMDEMITVYNTGNITNLYKLVNDNGMMADFKTALLDNRNVAWIPQLEGFFKQGSTFVAVGAGHLPGKKGVLELLKEKGYTVEVVHL